jgi:hypothetical protein
MTYAQFERVADRTLFLVGMCMVVFGARIAFGWGGVLIAAGGLLIFVAKLSKDP